MKYIMLACSAFLLTACTSTHRLMVVYESDQAVQGTISIMEEAVPKSVTVVQPKVTGDIYAPEPVTVEVEDNETSVLDSVRNLLP